MLNTCASAKEQAPRCGFFTVSYARTLGHATNSSYPRASFADCRLSYGVTRLE